MPSNLEHSCKKFMSTICETNRKCLTVFSKCHIFAFQDDVLTQYAVFLWFLCSDTLNPCLMYNACPDQSVPKSSITLLKFIFFAHIHDSDILKKISTSTSVEQIRHCSFYVSLKETEGVAVFMYTLYMRKPRLIESHFSINLNVKYSGFLIIFG